MNSFSSAIRSIVTCAALSLLAPISHGADQTVTGNLFVTGTADIDGNSLSLGTQGSVPGLNLTYANADADTLTFYLNRNPGSWLWAHSSAIAAMRLTANHELLLYKADGTTVGLALFPATNTVMLGSAALYRDSSTGALRTNGALTADGPLTVSSITTAGAINVGATASFQQNGQPVLQTTSDSTFTGRSAGNTTNTASGNTATGSSALGLVTTGSQNTAFGYFALAENTTGYRNAAFGAYALWKNTTGYQNMAIGRAALGSNTTGVGNVAIGSPSMAINQTGNDNTAIGRFAGSALTGSGNLLIGHGAGENLTTGSNNIVLGYNIDPPSVTGSSQLTIGNLIFGVGVNGTGTTISTGNVGIGTSTPSARLDVAGDVNATGVIKRNGVPIDANSVGPVYNVKKDFSATGDGTADDTTALQAAFSAAAGTGGTVYFPRGIYKISSALALSASGVTVQGDGPSSSIIKSASQSMGKQFNVTGSNMRVRDLGFDGSYSSGATSGNFALIDLTDASNIRISDCRVYRSLHLGIAIRGGSNDVAIVNSRFETNFCSIHSFSSAGLAPQRVLISNCDFVNNWGTGGESGAIKLQSKLPDNTISAGHSIIGNRMSNTGQMGIELWKNIHNATITGNTIEDVDFGISLDHVVNVAVTANSIRRVGYVGIEASASPSDVIIAGNTVSCYTASGSRGAEYGILTSNVPPVRITVSSNRVMGCSGKGIQLQTTTDSAIVSNQVYDCGIAIYLHNSSRIQIHGNTMDDPVHYHLFIDCGDSSQSNIDVSDNIFVGGVTDDNIMIYDAGHGNTLSNLIVKGNNLAAASNSNLTINYNIPVSRLPYLFITGNYYIPGSSVSLPDGGRTDQVPVPFNPTEQQFGIPVAKTIKFTVPASTADQWYKVFSTSGHGIPISLPFHVSVDSLSTNNNYSSITFYLAASPYGQDSTITKMPDAWYQGGALKAVVYNNPASDVTHELWLRFGPTGGGSVTVAGADFASNWITAPVAVTTQPTWASNSYECSANSHFSAFATKKIATNSLRVGNGAEISKILTASAAWDPPSLSDGGVAATTVTCSGVATGDPVQVSLSNAGGNNVLLSAHVQGADTVRVVLMNKSGSALDLPQGQLRVMATRF